MGEDEAEITLNEGADVWVFEVEDSKGKKIWEGEKIVKASISSQENIILIAALKACIL